MVQFCTAEESDRRQRCVQMCGFLLLANIPGHFHWCFITTVLLVCILLQCLASSYLKALAQVFLQASGKLWRHTNGAFAVVRVPDRFLNVL